MTRLELVTFVYVFAFSAFFLSLLWWTPAAWLAFLVGISCFAIGVGLVLQLRRTPKDRRD
jgi:uncharacterized membrane protein